MARIAVFACPQGIGHAKRSLAIVRELESALAGVATYFAAGELAVELLPLAGLEVTVRLSQERRTAGLLPQHRWRVRWKFILSELELARQTLAAIWTWRPDVALFDEVLLGVFVAKLMRCRVGFITDMPFAAPADPAAPPGQRMSDLVINGLRRRAIHASDLAIYPGTRDHLPDPTLWPWVCRHLRVIGAVAATTSSREPADVRREHGIPRDVPLVVATVGGSAAGRGILEGALRAWRRVDLGCAHLVVICGPAIDPSDLPVPASDRVHMFGMVDNVPSWLAAADLAITHAGLTTISECLSVGVPMVCIPLPGHWEQENNSRYAAGRGATVLHGSREALECALAATFRRLLASPCRTRGSGDLYERSDLPGGGAVEASHALAHLFRA